MNKILTLIIGILLFLGYGFSFCMISKSDSVKVSSVTSKVEELIKKKPELGPKLIKAIDNYMEKFEFESRGYCILETLKFDIEPIVEKFKVKIGINTKDTCFNYLYNLRRDERLKSGKEKTGGAYDPMVIGDKIYFIGGSMGYYYFYETYYKDCDNFKLAFPDIISSKILVDGDYIYFQNPDDGWLIYRIKFDGSGKLKVANHVGDLFKIEGDYLYYTEKNSEKTIHKVKKDGSNVDFQVQQKLYDTSGARPLYPVLIYKDKDGNVINNKITPTLEAKYVEILQKGKSFDYANFSTSSARALDNYYQSEFDYLKSKEETFIQLLDNEGLPIIKDFKLDDKEFIVSLPYSTYKGYDGKSCGYFPYEGSKWDSNICLIFEKDGDQTNLKFLSGEYIRDATKIIDNKYLLLKNGWGEMGSFYADYHLFDSDLKMISQLEKYTQGFEGMIFEDKYFYRNQFCKGNYCINFLTINNDTKMPGNNSFFGRLTLTYRQDKEEYIIEDKLYPISTKYEFDLEKNFFIENKFIVAIDGDLQSFDVKGSSGVKIDKNQNLEFLLKKYSNDYYQIIGVNDKYLDSKAVEQVEVLSCKDNSNYYDDEYYTIQNINLDDSLIFRYNIKSSFNNFCSIPYKIKVKYDDGSQSEFEFDVNFN